MRGGGALHIEKHVFANAPLSILWNALTIEILETLRLLCVRFLPNHPVDLQREIFLALSVFSANLLNYGYSRIREKQGSMMFVLSNSMHQKETTIINYLKTSVMSVKHIFGNINADGSVYSGSGDFSVVAEGDNSGEYTIIFRNPFSEVPSTSAIQNYPTWNDFRSNGGDTRDNVTLIAIDKDKVKLKTGDSNGLGVDRNFSFIVVGAE